MSTPEKSWEPWKDTIPIMKGSRPPETPFSHHELLQQAHVDALWQRVLSLEAQMRQVLARLEEQQP